MPIDTDRLVKAFGETLIKRRRPGDSAQEQIEQIALPKARAIVGFMEGCARASTRTLMQQPRLKTSSASVNTKDLSLDFTIDLIIEGKLLKRHLPILMKVGIQEVKVINTTFDAGEEARIYEHISELMMIFFTDIQREIPDDRLRSPVVVDADDDDA